MNTLNLESKGKYRDLAKLPNPGRLYLVIVPSLVEQFLNAEEKLGRELTRAEAETIRDEASAVAIDDAMSDQLAYDRHYMEIDPEAPYDSWRSQREGDAWRGSYE